MSAIQLCPGVAKGIQWLSNINMVLALTLAAFLVVVGPTVLILDLLTTTVGKLRRRPPPGDEGASDDELS